MGGGGHYPYPKEVWSPAGGWWSRPHNWVSNTVVAAVGIGLATWGVWRVSARNETKRISQKELGDSADTGVGETYRTHEPYSITTVVTASPATWSQGVDPANGI